MYCPKCATPLPDDSKFCRACGLNLDIISRVLSDQSQADKLKSVFDGSEQIKGRTKRLQNLGVLIIMASLLVGCVIPVLVGIAPPNLESLIMILAGVCGILLFGGVSLLIYSDMSPKVPAAKVSTVADKFPEALPRAENNELLSAGFPEPARSVTERTTNLLETDKIKIPR